MTFTPYTVFNGILPSDYSPGLQSTPLDIGIQFLITGDGCQLNGYYWYLPVSADANGADYSFRLYSTTTGATGTLISGSTVTGSGTWTVNSWNFTPLASPVALTNGTTYVAVATMPATYLPGESASNYWTTGGAGVSGVLTGPISAPATSGALGGKQQPFNSPSTGGFPTNGTNAFYGIDVNITRPVTTPLGNPAGGPWTLAFSDDFDTPYPTPYGTGPNPAVWADCNVNGLRIATGANSLEWAARGYYGHSVANGILTLTSIFQNPQLIDPTAPNPLYPGGNTGKYTSGVASSWHGFAMTYGYAEARIINVNSGTSGAWPAFWMMPTGGPQIPPEIDTSEYDSPGNSGTTHAGYDNVAAVFTNHYYTGPSQMDGIWHVYGVMWSATTVTWYYDGVQVFTTTYDGNAFPWALQFDNAVHDNLTGTGFPQKYQIDYCRAWVVTGVPSQPVITSISPSNGVPTAGQVTVNFAPVAGATSYRVTSCITNLWDFAGTGSSQTALFATGSSGPLTVTGLTNGTPYHFTVAAENATGFSIESLPLPPQGPASGGTGSPLIAREVLTDITQTATYQVVYEGELLWE